MNTLRNGKGGNRETSQETTTAMQVKTNCSFDQDDSKVKRICPFIKHFKSRSHVLLMN